MSEVNIPKRKEKCENCTKQCNKKQSDDGGANTQQDREELNGQVHEGSQILLSACLSCDGCMSEDESLKISQQSLEEVERVLALNKVQSDLWNLMEQRKTSVEELDSVPLDHVLGECGDVSLGRHEGRGSEGFLEHIFKHAAKELFGLDVHEITYKTLRNRDFQEVTLERDGETLLQFAAVYGFRNIQTLVHRMRKGSVPYQLVEVLSCPGGCLSGRGQAESEAGGRVDKALVQQMEDAYSSLPVRLPDVNPTLQTLYQDWLQGQDSPQAGTLLHTQHRSQGQIPPQPLHMQWSFHDDSEVVYLSLNDGLVTKETPAAEFKGRVRAAPRVAMRTGLVGFVLQLSPLRREDTDMYYCSWLYFRHDTASIELLNSTGTLIIVRETDPNKTCWDRIYFGILVFFGLAPLLVIAIVLVVRFKRSNRYRVVKSARPARPPHVCQHCPYMITSVNTIDYMDTLP